MIYSTSMKKASDYFKSAQKGETLIAPNNPAVLAYLKAAREGKGLADKFFADRKKVQKSSKK